MHIEGESRFGEPRARLPIAIMALLAAWALILRLPTLMLRQMVEGDGVHYARLAQQILAGDLSGMANPYWSNLWPLLIAATSRLTILDVVTAGRLASLAASVCLVPCTAALATRALGWPSGLATGLLVAAHPWLIHFSTLVYTEALFTLLVVATLVMLLDATQSSRSAASTAILTGLAFLTRPEAYALVVVAMGWLILSAWRCRLLRAWARPALYLFVVAVIVLGRAGLVRHFHGLWDIGIGSKGVANLIVGLAQTDAEKVRIAGEVTPEGDNRLAQQAEQISLLGFASSHPVLFAAHSRRNAVQLADSLLRVFPFVPLIGGRSALWSFDWPPALIALALVASLLVLHGLFIGWRERKSRTGVTLLASVIALYLLGLTLFIVHDRLVVALIPLFLIFLGHSLASLAIRLTAGHAIRFTLVLVGPLIVGALLSLIGLWRAPELDYASEREVQRTAGEWLAAHYSQSIRIMTSSPHIGFYFYEVRYAGNEENLPWLELPELITLARRREIRLLVATDWHLLAIVHPAARLLVNPALAPPELRLVATLGRSQTGLIFIYEVQPADADRAAS